MRKAPSTKKFRESRTISIVLVCVILLVSLSGCSQPERTSTPTPLPHPTPTPVPGIPTPRVLPFSVTTDKSQYLPGEIIRIKLTLENDRDERVNVFPFPPEVKIVKRITGETIRIFPSGSKEVELKPGESISHTLRWDHRDERGKEVMPGSYDIMIGDIKVRNKESYGFGGFGKELLISYPQGALSKTIELNESKTANGATVVLQKIEFTPSEVKFYLLTDVTLAKTSMPPGVVSYFPNKLIIYT